MTSRTMLALACTAALLGATPAFAEGGLQIFPDLIDDLMYGTYGGALVAAPWKSIWVQLIARFVALALVLNPLLFKPLLRLLDARGERIDGARERAGALTKQADAVLGRYESAIGTARREAEGVRRGALESARQEQARVTSAARGDAERALASARSDLASSVASARSALRGDGERLAREAAARVLGRPLG
jgi:F-type H+-transporting ATPase subunit b